jgi:alkaline phosphatase
METFFMKHPVFARKCLHALLGAALGAVSGASFAAPTISRLTPPSNPVAAGAETLARFLPGQRFDLQATVLPSGGGYITSVEFKVDNVTVGTVSATPPVTSVFSGNKSIVPASALSGFSTSHAVAASLRAYSNAVPGLHNLTVVAKQDDGSTSTTSGNFEVIGTGSHGEGIKNVIILLGDGMGAAHRTAARIVAKGYLQGKAQGRLAMDTFPYTGMVMTASLNSIITDSAPGMANYVNGNKAQNNQEGVFPDDTSDAFDNPRVEYLSEYFHRTKGKKLGIVTTADVFDATPAANAVHTSNRGNGTGIVDQYLDDRGLTGLTVLMGGGRKWFLPNASNSVSPQPANGSQRRNSTDYVLPADIVTGWGAAPGVLDSARNLISDFQAAGFTYAPDHASMASASESKPLLGLFSYSNMNVAADKIGKRRGTSTIVDDYGFPDQPMLDEMADKALKTLHAQSPHGFILMIEGASIDKRAHLMDTDRWIQETIEFDRAVQKAKDFAKTHGDTLVIVTADHECAGVALIGGSLGTGVGGSANQANVGLYDAAKFPKYQIDADGYPHTTDFTGKLLVGYGSNADRYESWLSNPKPTQDSQQPFVGVAPLNSYPANANVRNGPTGGFLITGQISGDQAAHTASDIPLSAYGSGARLFTGVFDNTDVFFKISRALLGGSESSDDQHGDDSDD